MYIVMLLGGMVYVSIKYLVDDVVEVFYILLIFCLVVLSVVEGCVEVSNHSYKSVYFSFQFCQFCFTYFSAIRADAFRIAVSSWWVDPFYHYIREKKQTKH